MAATHCSRHSPLSSRLCQFKNTIIKPPNKKTQYLPWWKLCNNRNIISRFLVENFFGCWTGMGQHCNNNTNNSCAHRNERKRNDRQCSRADDLILDPGVKNRTVGVIWVLDINIPKNLIDRYTLVTSSPTVHTHTRLFHVRHTRTRKIMAILFQQHTKFISHTHSLENRILFSPSREITRGENRTHGRLTGYCGPCRGGWSSRHISLSHPFF